VAQSFFSTLKLELVYESARKRRTVFRFETIHTLRYLCFARAGVLLYPDGYATLDVGPAPAVADRSTAS